MKPTRPLFGTSGALKKGSKGEQAWKLLQRGLKAIQAAYGDAVDQRAASSRTGHQWPVASRSPSPTEDEAPQARWPFIFQQPASAFTGASNGLQAQSDLDWLKPQMTEMHFR